jgi:S-adenosylmethionine:tRNA ribosyltransferase-isomerase
VWIKGRGRVEDLLRDHGQAPLPPYIRRTAGDPRLAFDRERYQTVFARSPGAVAAPTAGLHFTQDLFERLTARGILSTTITLHVGEASFWPVRESDVKAIELPPERFEAPAAAADAIAAARARRGRVVAVGTTVVRALESLPDAADGAPAPNAGATRLFIAPGHRFRFVDALLTNFHLPRSSLLMLVSAFAGRDTILEAYREAIRMGYRFYSYGDAMLIL